MITENPHIADMAAYAVPEVGAAGRHVVGLAQNESLRPPSPHAAERAAQGLAHGQLYPDPGCTDLRVALGRLHDLEPDRILCGAGSLDLIGALMRVYAGPERRVLIPAHAYPFFASAAAMVGAPCDVAGAGLTADVDALLRAATLETRLVFLANPANPTGTRVPRADLVRLREGLPRQALLIIDEAYGEFADHLEAPDFSLIDRGDTVFLRTFSKAYGLAGSRIGWAAAAPHVLASLGKVLNPNGVSAAAQAVALGALEDQAYMRDTCSMTAELRDSCVARLSQAAVVVTPSFTNFVLVSFETPAQANTVAQRMLGAGFALRGQGGAGLPQCLRMTIPQWETLTAAQEALLAILDMEKRQ